MLLLLIIASTYDHTKKKQKPFILDSAHLFLSPTHEYYFPFFYFIFSTNAKKLFCVVFLSIVMRISQMSIVRLEHCILHILFSLRFICVGGFIPTHVVPVCVWIFIFVHVNIKDSGTGAVGEMNIHEFYFFVLWTFALLISDTKLTFWSKFMFLKYLLEF